MLSIGQSGDEVMAAEDKLVADIAALSDRLAEARASIERRFVGQHAVVEQVLAAILALIGMATLWFNFIGVNLLVSGLHSYAGLN